MNSLVKPVVVGSQTDSNSRSSSSSANVPQPYNNQLDERLWRTIDFLHIFVMIFAMYTSVIVGNLRNDFSEQCPLYAQVYFRENVTQLSSDNRAQQTIWGSVYTCEWASFAYLSAFALSFISLWIHIVFRRVLHTERLLRLPIGLTTLLFTLLALVATIIVTDGVIKLCTRSDPNLCASSGPPAFNRSRWKVISLPVGGWLTTVSLALNAIARGIQLFSKPKKSPETLKLLLNQMMTFRQQEKLDKDPSVQGSQTSRFSPDRIEIKPPSSQGSPNEPSAHYYPPVPQYRQIKKPSLFQRLCCPCRRRRRRRSRNLYRSFTVPDPYFSSSFDPRSSSPNTSNHLCSRHSIHHHSAAAAPPERQVPIDSISARLSPDQSSEASFPGRRRSSVRFEDPLPVVTGPPITPIEKKDPEQSSISPSDLQRSVSFRNNEDDLWTTVTIKAEASTSSHFHRLAVDHHFSPNTTSIPAISPITDNGITAIRVNSQSNIDEYIESSLPPTPPPPPPISSMISNRYQRISSRQPFPARSFTPSSEDDGDLHHIKPVEEIQAIVTDKYNYNDVSEALKSNVQRLKKTFLPTSNQSSHYDRPKNLRIPSIRTLNSEHHVSDC